MGKKISGTQLRKAKYRLFSCSQPRLTDAIIVIFSNYFLMSTLSSDGFFFCHRNTILTGDTPQTKTISHFSFLIPFMNPSCPPFVQNMNLKKCSEPLDKRTSVWYNMDTLKIQVFVLHEQYRTISYQEDNEWTITALFCTTRAKN